MSIHSVATKAIDGQKPGTSGLRKKTQVFMSPQDAEARSVKDNDLVWIESRRGRIKARVETNGRNRMPRGMVFVPWFDEGVFINKTTLDATCPISKQIDFKKCAAKVYKA